MTWLAQRLKYRVRWERKHKSNSPIGGAKEFFVSAAPQVSLTNPNFDAGAGWVTGPGWSIASGVASIDGTNIAPSALTQSVPGLTAEKDYEVVFRVAGLTAGGFTVVLGGSTSAVFSDNGLQKAFVTTPSTAGPYDLEFLASIGSVFTLDDIELRPVKRKYLGLDETVHGSEESGRQNKNTYTMTGTIRFDDTVQTDDFALIQRDLRRLRVLELKRQDYEYMSLLLRYEYRDPS